MYSTLLSDFSRVLLFPKDTAYTGGLNALHKQLKEKLGDNYRPLDYFEFNTELLDFYKSLKNRYSLNILTTDVIQNHHDIRRHLDGLFKNVFSASELGLEKTEPGSYLFIAKRLNVKPETVVYIDDQITNVNAAEAASMAAVHYQNDNRKAIARISGFLAPEKM